MAAAEPAAVELKPCEHQAGGHFAKGKDAATFVDGSGKFYKAFQDDSRGGREAAVYELIFNDGAADVRHEDMVALRDFVPKYHGTVVSGEKKLLALDDTCSRYNKPSVLDAKMGLSTTYDWADDHYKEKNKGKDAASTQASLGYRVTGFKAWQIEKGENFVADRLYGKAITPATMGASLAQFGTNGVLTPKDIFGGPNGAVAQIRQLQKWFEEQRSLCFFAASILVIYEGTATKVEDANVTIKFIDFAHTFPSKGVKDDNVLTGVKNLADLMEQVAEGKV